MAEDPRPPVAVRITRPYRNEDEFLEHELETLTRTSVTLLGAQPRRQGLVLRFELVLSSGHPILRGEGRVVGFKPDVLLGLGGLTLRFTRLDSRSKALVDRAGAERSRRTRLAPSSPPPPAPPSSDRPAPPSVPPPPPVPAFSRPEAPPLGSAPVPEPPAPVSEPLAPVSEPLAPVSEPLAPVSVSPAAVSVSPAAVSVRPKSTIPPPPPPEELKHAPPRAEARAAARPPGAMQAPAGREALLERLRARGKRLDPAEAQRILAQRRRA